MKTSPPIPPETHTEPAETIEAPELEDLRVVERPDGYYWQSPDGKHEHGPFKTYLAAQEDMRVFDEDSLEVGESLEEAESEIGISDWIDPDTGELAEEGFSRIEEH